MVKKYSFESVSVCEMCGADGSSHRVLGQRLNQSQGLSPKTKAGISVSIKKCSRCHLIYSAPQPIPFDIQDHYGLPADSYWNAAYFEVRESYFKKEIDEVKSLLVAHQEMSALDVGAGLGKCMIALEKAGFTAYGFEPSKPFFERAISKMKISPEKLKLGTIEETDYPDASFDFITFGAVLEHLYHPATCIQKSLKWLKPNGIIHIEVPSSGWLIAKLVNVYYRLRGTTYVTNLSPMHAPFHLFEFDLKSFQLLGEKLGFVVEYHRHEVYVIPYVPKLLQPVFRFIMEKTRTGMQLVVYLRKR